MLFTVKKNKGYFGKHENEGENADTNLPNRIGWPSPTKLKSIVKSGQLKNKKLQLNIFTGTIIFMANRYDYQKETLVDKKNPVYPQIHWVPLPAPILRLHKYVTLEWYSLFINGINFLTSQSHKTKYFSIERTKSRVNKKF